jgi:hypothetical protein
VGDVIQKMPGQHLDLVLPYGRSLSAEQRRGIMATIITDVQSRLTPTGGCPFSGI